MFSAFINNAKRKEKNEQTPLDIYYNDLEEAYGNLPVPSDDWAGVKELLEENGLSNAQEEIAKLEEAIETIRTHYLHIAKILKKQTRF